MPALSLAPALHLVSAFTRLSPTQPLRTFLRTTGYKLRPPRPVPFSPSVRQRQDAVLASGQAGLHQAASVLWEQRPGPTPTLVLGGFVPDATEQVFLLRGFMLRRGSVYYCNFPRHGFSVDLLFAQLEDLVEELNQRHGTPPVIFGVSFGAGLILEWLRRARLGGRSPALGGLLLVSPVACLEDLLDPRAPKPTTLLGRAVKPFLQSEAPPEAAHIERSRGIFTKMFEAGAQNKASLRALMTAGELKYLHSSVISTIRAIDAQGAAERILSLRQMVPPTSYFAQPLLPLSTAPTLILYAEKESSVLVDESPTRFALATAHRAYFPESRCEIIANPHGAAVQHASLIFHYFNFLPAIASFYRRLRTPRRQAA